VSRFQESHGQFLTTVRNLGYNNKFSSKNEDNTKSEEESVDGSGLVGEGLK